MCHAVDDGSAAVLRRVRGDEDRLGGGGGGEKMGLRGKKVELGDRQTEVNFEFEPRAIVKNRATEKRKTTSLNS